MQSSLGRAVPDPGRVQPSHEQGFPVIPPARVDLAGGEVAGLAALPNHVVALAAVPDWGARPFSTRPSLPGARGLAVVPFPPSQSDHRIVALRSTRRSLHRSGRQDEYLAR
jgi:hypothetical protein